MTIAIQFAITFATLLVEYEHLVTLYQRRKYFANYFCTCNCRNTYRYLTIVVNQQNFFKFNSLAAFCALNVVYEKLLAFFYLELLTVNLYDCVHYICIKRISPGGVSHSRPLVLPRRTLNRRKVSTISENKKG